MNNWNSDSTIFWVLANGGIIPYRFDAATMKATRIPKASDPSGGLYLPYTGPFSHSKPNILYGTVGMTIVQYDFNTNAQQTVFDARKAVSSASQYAHVPSVSDDDTKLCLAFGGTQGTFPYVAVLDRTTGAYHVLDTMKSRIDGKAANQTLGYGLYSAFIDRTGRYVMLLTGDGSLSAVWDVSAAKVYAATAQNGGSPASGFGTAVNLSGYQAYSMTEPIEWSVRALSQANINNTQYLVNPSSLPTPHQNIYEGRISWNNAQSGALAPVVGSINRNIQAAAPWRAWDNEIIAIATDGSGQVWRFAHHHSAWDSTNANDLARGNVSQDGRWYSFQSNWGKALGTDPSGKLRQDVFVVDLNSSKVDATLPTVSITSPSANTTVSGTVTVQASATDAAGIAGVQFRVDGSNLGAEVTAAPYTTVWNTTGATAGAHSLTAVARDSAGNVATSAAVSITVGDTTAPAVSITSPANGTTVSGAVTIAATATDNSAIAGVQFYVDGAGLGAEDATAPYTAMWDATSVSGSHILTAVVRDAAGNKATSAPVSVTVQHTGAPLIAITSPANAATVSGAVTLSVSASDPVGVSSVQYMLNGAPLGSRLTAAPYAMTWNTSSVANGLYTLTAQATDTANNSATSAPVSVGVNNIVGTPGPGSPALATPANNATSVATNTTLTWGAASYAGSYDVYLGTTAPPPFVGNTAATSYTPGSLFGGTTYYWYVVAKNSAGNATSPTWSFSTATTSGGGGTTTGSMLSYTSPSCGPSGGTTSWACGAWPSNNAPLLGAAGTTTSDADTGNRVLRLTQSGSFGESAGAAFKVFDGGWRQAWNANDTRVMVQPWDTGNVKHPAYWLGFNPSSMSLTGANGFVPMGMNDYQWDQSDPDAVVGTVNGVAQTYNVVTGAYTKVFDPATTKWGGTTWISAWGGPSVCIAEGPQDNGYRLACYNRQTQQGQAIDLHSQTINGQRFTVYFQGNSVTLPSSIGVHTITMGMDGRWLAVDTHGNSMCTIGGLTSYASTALFLDLQNKVGYEWNVGCGGTHWAYGYNGIMMQSSSPKWTPTGADSPCNSDSRGLGRRSTDSRIDSSYATTGPCSFFNPATWNINVHLSWTNNFNDSNVNKYPVLMATTNEGVSNMFIYSDIAAMETSAPAFQGKIWRFAQTWNDQPSNQCGFVTYSSPSISRSGRFALFPSDWRGQTGSNGVCTNGKRTDVFLFELK